MRLQLALCFSRGETDAQASFHPIAYILAKCTIGVPLFYLLHLIYSQSSKMMASTVSSKVCIRSPVAFSARRAGAMTARRTLVISADGRQGKGGEEGGAVFDK